MGQTLVGMEKLPLINTDCDGQIEQVFLHVILKALGDYLLQYPGYHPYIDSSLPWPHHLCDNYY